MVKTLRYRVTKTWTGSNPGERTMFFASKRAALRHARLFVDVALIASIVVEDTVTGARLY